MTSAEPDVSCALCSTGDNSTANASAAELLEELNRAALPTLLPAMTYLSVVALSGTVGNILVLLVYLRSFRPSTTRFLILSLAVVDLWACAVAIPGEVARLRLQHSFHNQTLCRLVRVTGALASLMSGLLVLITAADRYWRICKPTRNHVTNKQAYVIVFGACVLSLAVGALYYNVSGLERVQTRWPGVQGSICSPVGDHAKGSPLTLVFYCVFFAMVVVSIVSVALLYLGIFFRLRKQRQYRHARRHTRADTTMAVSQVDRDYGTTLERRRDGNRQFGDVSTDPSAGSDADKARVAKARALLLKTLAASGCINKVASGARTPGASGQTVPRDGGGTGGCDKGGIGGLDTGGTRGRDIGGTGGCDTSGIGGLDTCGTGGRDIGGIGGRDMNGTGGRDMRGNGGRDTCGTVQRDISGTGGRDTGGTGGRNIDDKGVRDTSGTSVRDTSGTSGRDTSGTGGRDTGGTSGRDTGGTGGRYTGGTSGLDTGGTSGRDTGGTSGRDTGGTGGRDTGGTGGRYTNGTGGRDTNVNGERDTCGTDGRYTSGPGGDAAPGQRGEEKNTQGAGVAGRDACSKEVCVLRASGSTAPESRRASTLPDQYKRKKAPRLLSYTSFRDSTSCIEKQFSYDRLNKLEDAADTSGDDQKKSTKVCDAKCSELKVRRTVSLNSSSPKKSATKEENLRDTDHTDKSPCNEDLPGNKSAPPSFKVPDSTKPRSSPPCPNDVTSSPPKAQAQTVTPDDEHPASASKTEPTVPQPPGASSETTESSLEPHDACQTSSTCKSCFPCFRDKVAAEGEIIEASVRDRGKRDRDPRQRLYKSRTTLILTIIGAVYVLSYLPFLALGLVWVGRGGNLHGLNMAEQQTFHLLYRSFYIGAAANPVLYSFFNAKFRAECAKLLRRPACLCRPCRR